jgi:predicted lipoprotein with Yx(FWY)xxD motif
MSAFGVGKLGKLGAGAASAAALVGLVAGCSSSSSPAQPAAAGPATSASSSAPQSASAAGGSASALKSASTSIGTVLVDGSGRTVYELVGDTAAKPTCTGGCLAVWPAVMANGTQVIVNGHPAFTFVKDGAAGQTKGQNVKDQWGLWLALDASGNPIAASSSAPASSAPTSSAKAPSGGGAAF